MREDLRAGEEKDVRFLPPAGASQIITTTSSIIESVIRILTCQLKSLLL